MQSHGREVADALETLSGPTKKVAAELLSKQGAKPAAAAQPTAAIQSAAVAQNGSAAQNGNASVKIPALSIPEAQESECPLICMRFALHQTKSKHILDRRQLSASSLYVTIEGGNFNVEDYTLRGVIKSRQDVTKRIKCVSSATYDNSAQPKLCVSDGQILQVQQGQEACELPDLRLPKLESLQ